MDLAFTEEQEMLRQTVRELCAKESSPDAVRALENDERGFDAGFYGQLARTDLLGLTIPEEYGGAGQTALESIVVYEEFGRALAASPHFVSAIVGAGVLMAGGSDQQKKEWLPKIVSGEAILTPAWLEAGGSCGPESVTTVAQNGRITGEKVLVPFANSATALIVSAREGDGSVGLFLVQPQDVGLIPVTTIGLDAESNVVLDGASAEPLCDWTAWEEASRAAMIALAGYATGGAERALEMAIAYANERVQFGRKIGSFQGIAHPLADMATEIQGGKVLAYQAAWAHANHKPLGPLAAMAKMYTADVFKRTTKVGQQVFGGIGFTLEIDMQLYFRRAKQLELQWWEPRYLERAIAAAELDAEQPFINVD
ncbi:MAG: acyl-CoA dehydrogenase family protein [Actinomycetota bacterium]